MNIFLLSYSLSRSELEAGLSITRAFFPEARVQVGELSESDTEGENGNLIKDLSMNHALTKLIQNQGIDYLNDLSMIQIEVSYHTTPWEVRGSFFSEAQTYAQMNKNTGTQFPVPTQEQSVLLKHEEVQTLLSHEKIGKETDQKILLRQGLYRLLSKVTGHVPPWGILTGIRPSKILHRLSDLGTSVDLAERVLQERYSIREDKVHLLQEIVAIQQPCLEEIKEHPQRVAVYVGIPFCPTRCSYCSFPAYSLEQGREPLKTYLYGLFEEIRVTGEWMKEMGLIADSLYIGGGTPTILTTSEITELIQRLMESIPHAVLDTPGALEAPGFLEGLGLPKGLELTVEAGRPDTLSREKLKALRAQGVNRLSINPQTMHDQTLKRIGRSHTVEDIIRVYELAREIQGWIINMDLILGLPGESLKDVQETLERIGRLKPDNLTVHALAIKRGSKVHEAGLIENMGKEMESMQENVLSSAYSLGLRPYYLYRQKHIAGNLENIGFARPGAECRYNIGIMEERQSVIGIGAGASSKVVNPVDYSLVNLQHPSNWQAYLKRWRENHQNRVSVLHHTLKFNLSDSFPMDRKACQRYF